MHSDDSLNAQARRIDLAHHSDFAVGVVKVRPSLRKILGPHGEVMLEPKVMQVFVALADPIGNIMSRDDLIDRCWDGRIVGDTSINRVISLLRTSLKTVADTAVVVENIPKVGYRLLVEGQVDEPVVAAPSASGAMIAEPNALRTRPKLVGALVIALALLVGAIVWLQPMSEPPVEDVRLVMLPLEAGEGVDPIFSSGLEAELRAAIARVGAMEVTTSESAQILDEQGISPAEIGRRLGARYVWTGRFDTDVERSALRIALIDADTGDEFFSRTIQSAPDEAEHLPFRTARAVTTALGRPSRGEDAPDEISAGDYRLYLVAVGLLKSRGNDQRLAALEILQQVTARNPGFADGLGALSKAYFLYPAFEPEAREQYTTKARETAQRAIEMAPDTVEAMKVLGISGTDPEEALSHLSRAVELDPGDSEGWFWLGITQRKFILQGGHPLTSARKMIEIDPLWPASWIGSDMAAQFGQLETAREMEGDVLAAAVAPSQRLYAEARIARLEGDLSRYVQLIQTAARTATEAERRWGADLQDRSMRILLGMTQLDGIAVPRQKAPARVMDQIDLARLPSRAVLRQYDLTGSGLWDDLNYVRGAMPLYLQYDRTEELIADYDTRFPDHAAYLAFAEASGQPEHVIPDISTYMVLALRNAGRQEEAEQHLESLERVIVRWREADLGWIDQQIILLEYAALIGDDEEAVRIVQSLPDFAWPYSVVKIDPTQFNILKDDPLFDKVRGLPAVRAVLDPIRARLKKEKAEIEALGV